MRKIILLLSLLVITTLTSGCIVQPSTTTTTISQTTVPITTTIKTTTITGTTTIPQTFKISIKNFAFNPATLTIKRGAIVTWTNDDSATHTVVITGVTNSGNIKSGQSFNYTFNNVGTFDYHCSIHPLMTGKVIVE
jgi:plastocyanin